VVEGRLVKNLEVFLPGRQPDGGEHVADLAVLRVRCQPVVRRLVEIDLIHYPVEQIRLLSRRLDR